MATKPDTDRISKQALENMNPPHFSQTKNTKKSEISNLMKMRVIIERLQKGLSLLTTASRSSSCPPPPGCDETETLEIAAVLPEDVKEGHFAVFAVVGKETTRFMTKLESLNDPALMELLEQTKDEYGFQRKGALEVYCQPEELHLILENCRIEQNRVVAAACINDDNSLPPWLKGF